MWKTNNFFIKQKITFLFLNKNFIFLDIFYNSQELNCLGIFFAETDTYKNIDMPRQKPQMLHR